MKKDRIYIILVLLCLLFVTGCDKMLETKSQTLLPQDKLQTEAGCVNIENFTQMKKCI